MGEECFMTRPFLALPLTLALSPQAGGGDLLRVCRTVEYLAPS
jgi:hypothetical protein